MPTSSPTVRMLLLAGLALAVLLSPLPPTAQAADWEQLPSIPMAPEGRMDHVMVADPLGGRLIMFGGMNGPGYDDIWELRPDADWIWRPLAALGDGPPAAAGQGAIYDPEQRRLVVFAGQVGPTSFLNDVWELDLAVEVPTWSLLEIAGTPPSPRRSPAVVYDPVSHRLLAYGGYDGGILGDMWALDLYAEAWVELDPGPQTPGPRLHPAVVFDLDAKRLVLMGGWGDGDDHDDVWVYGCAGIPGWAELQPAGERPAPRYGHAGYLDPWTGDLIIHGGEGQSMLDDVWRLELGVEPAWSPVVLDGNRPCPRRGHTAVNCLEFGEAIVFGGYTGETPYYVADTWQLQLGDAPAWTELEAWEGRRSGHAAVYDPQEQRLLVVGGARVDGLGNDVWQLTLDQAPTWSRVAMTGTSPAVPEPRYGHSLILDPVQHRLVLFGGYVDGLSGDTWALSLQPAVEWRRLEFIGPTPPPRTEHTAIYDAPNQRMVIFGGAGATGSLQDTWALTFDETPSWQPIDATGPPCGRDEHAAVYDPVRQRMLVLGGRDDLWNELDDVWALSLDGTPTWQQLTIWGPEPLARFSHVAVYDPTGDRILLHGGESFSSGYLDDLWSLELGGAPTWTALDPGDPRPAERGRHVGVMDLALDRLVIFGGRHMPWPPLGDAWAFGDDVTAAPGTHDTRASLLLGPPHPNPLHGRTTIAFALPTAAPVTLEIVDVSGRRVRVLCDEVRPAGHQAVTWDGRDGSGRPAPSGVYLYRLQTSGRQMTGRVVVAR
jgi:hypothetical protein